MPNVIVAFPKEESSRKFKSILSQCGYQASVIAKSGSQILNRANELRYGVVLTGYRMGDLLWNELGENLPEGFCMVLLLAENRLEEVRSSELLQKKDGRTFVLEVPFVIADLLEIMEKASVKTESIRRRDKQKPRKRSPEEIAAINRAKDLLMEKRKMNETAAHHYLQRRSMESQVSMAECAQKVIRMLEETERSPL